MYGLHYAFKGFKHNYRNLSTKCQQLRCYRFVLITSNVDAVTAAAIPLQLKVSDETGLLMTINTIKGLFQMKHLPYLFIYL